MKTRPDGPNVVVISERFWHRRFNADSNVIGRNLRFGSSSWQIAGVMPGIVSFPGSGRGYLDSRIATPGVDGKPGSRFYTTVGRLRPGVSRSQAQADLDVLQGRLALGYPATEAGWTVEVEPLKEETVGDVRQSLWILFGAVSLVLLIACSNVACLMLVRASQRERDMAVRSSWVPGGCN